VHTDLVREQPTTSESLRASTVMEVQCGATFGGCADARLHAKGAPTGPIRLGCSYMVLMTPKSRTYFHSDEKTMPEEDAAMKIVAQGSEAYQCSILWPAEHSGSKPLLHVEKRVGWNV
jgi:hypothetical protein